jgi:hypothetical protein
LRCRIPSFPRFIYDIVRQIGSAIELNDASGFDIVETFLDQPLQFGFFPFLASQEPQAGMNSLVCIPIDAGANFLIDERMIVIIQSDIHRDDLLLFQST